MSKIPRPYQVEAFNYAYVNQHHPALFMEMRLGKTLVAVKRITKYEPRDPGRGLRVLVIAPNSAFRSWRNELTDAGCSFTNLRGTRAQRLAALEADETEWYLLNKEGLRVVPEVGGAVTCDKCNGKRKKESGVACPYCKGLGFVLSKSVYAWDAVVVDESIFIKTPDAQITKLCHTCFRDVPHRWIMTGLPNPEGDLDYACQLIYLDGHIMGARNYWEWRHRFFKPQWDHTWKPKSPEIEQRISEYIGARCFIRRRKDVGLEVPKIKEVRELELPHALRKTYEAAERDFVLMLEGKEVKSTVWTMVQYQWLRQICGGFVDGKLVWRGKLDELRTLLEGELKHEQVVVWFAYNQELDAALSMLDDAEKINGEVKDKDRDDVLDRFERGQTRVLLLQHEVAETGMDLSAADTAIYYSEPLGLSGSKQTEDRILQVDKSGLLYIYLLVDNSVDMDIRESLELKEQGSERSLFKALHSKFIGRVMSRR